MKLLIIGPSRYNDDGSILKRNKVPFPRLNLIFLASLAPKNVDVTTVDEIVEPLDIEADCDLVAITILTSQAVRAYDIADAFRKRGKKVVMGGIHVSALPEEAKQHADSIVIGEADYLWETIINDFKDNDLKPIYKCEKLHDLKGLPIPRYDLVKKGGYMTSTLPVWASRGCPHNCDFCTVTKFFGNTYRFRPVDDVVRDIKASGSKRFFFIDDNIIANRKYSEELFTKLIPLKIRWNGQSTINIGKFPELCSLASRSGCFFLCIGIESINQESLKTVSKGQNNVSDYYKYLKTIKDNGLSVQLSMIVGFDKDDETIFDNTLKFVSDIKPHLVSLNVPIPYPGTTFTKNLENAGRILHKDWSQYRVGKVVFKPKLLSRDELETKAASTFKKLYSLNSIISRSLAQPKGHFAPSIATNYVARKFVLKNEWLNAG